MTGAEMRTMWRIARVKGRFGSPSLRRDELRSCEGLARTAVADGCRDADRLPHASRACTENNHFLGLVSSLDLLQSIASGRVRADNGNLDSARS